MAGRSFTCIRGDRYTMTIENKRRLTLLEIAAFLTALSAIAYQYFNTRSADLHAELTSSIFVVPPGISEAFEGLRGVADHGDLQKNLNIEHDLTFISHDPQLIKDTTTAIVNDVSLYLVQRLPWRLPEPYSLLGGIWTGSIKNTGDNTARGVTLSVPFTKYFCQQREGAEAKCEAARDIVRVGDLQPQETVIVRLWTSIAPDVYEESRVHLAFMEGTGSVRILAPASPFWRWMERNWLFLLFLIATVTIPTLGMVIGFLVDKRLARQASSSNARAEAPRGQRRPRRPN